MTKAYEITNKAMKAPWIFLFYLQNRARIRRHFVKLERLQSLIRIKGRTFPIEHSL